MSNYQLQARSPLEILMGLTPFDAARLGHGFYMGSLGRPVEPALFPSAIPPSTSPATKPSSGGPPYPPGTPGSAAPQDLPVTPIGNSTIFSGFCPTTAAGRAPHTEGKRRCHLKKENQAIRAGAQRLLGGSGACP